MNRTVRLSESPAYADRTRGGFYDRDHARGGVVRALRNIVSVVMATDNHHLLTVFRCPAGLRRRSMMSEVR